MNSKYVFGWIATTFSLTYKLPQIYVLCKKKKREGLSIVSLGCQACAYGFYIAHGAVNEDWAILCMAVASFAQSAILIALYCQYTPSPSGPSGPSGPTAPETTPDTHLECGD